MRKQLKSLFQQYGIKKNLNDGKKNWDRNNGKNIACKGKSK